MYDDVGYEKIHHFLKIFRPQFFTQPMKRLITSQGPLQLLSALSVITDEARRGGGKHEDHLLIHGTAMSASASHINDAMRELASLWIWTSVTFLPEYEPKLLTLMSGKPADAHEALKQILGFMQVDRLYVCRNWQATNELIMNTFPEACHVVYGDSFGQIDSLDLPSQPKVNELYASMLHQSFPFGSEPLIDPRKFPFTVVPRLVILDLIKRFTETSQSTLKLREDLGTQAADSCLLILKNGAESQLLSLEDEVRLYAASVDEVVGKVSRLIIKPHPREMLHTSKILASVIRAHYDLETFVLGNDTFLESLPIEIFCQNIKFAKVLSPLPSIAKRNLKSLLNIECGKPLEAPILALMNPVRRRHQLMIEFINTKIFARLPAWDENSVLCCWSDFKAEWQEYERHWDQLGNIWPTFVNPAGPEILSTLRDIEDASSRNHIPALKSSLQKILAQAPGDADLLIQVAEISRAIGEPALGISATRMVSILNAHDARAYRFSAILHAEQRDTLGEIVARECASAFQ